MTESLPMTSQLIATIVQFFVAPAGAGWLAWWLINALRGWLPKDNDYTGMLRLAQTVLYNRLYVRILALVLLVIIGATASAILAYLSGQDVMSALDSAIFALSGYAWNQFIQAVMKDRQASDVQPE